MQADEKPIHSQKLTVEIAVRLKVMVSSERFPRPQDPPLNEPGFWKITPVWKVSMIAGPDPQFTFENTNPDSRDWTETDGDAVAKKFLNVKSPEAALAFFQKYFLGEVKKTDDAGKICIGWSELQGIQKAFIAALSDSDEPVEPEQLKQFVFQPLQVQLAHSEKIVQVISGKPVKKEKVDAVNGLVECTDVLGTLGSLVFLSRGSVWRKCANPKCEMWFKPNRPDQICHDTACTRRAVANRYSEKTRRNKNRRNKKGRKRS